MSDEYAPDEFNDDHDFTFGVPAFMQEVASWREYRVREELFDPEWVEEETGLAYTHDD